MTVTKNPADDEPTDNGEANDDDVWKAIVADLSGQVDLGPEFRQGPPPAELDYIDAYFDEGYEPPEAPPIQVPTDAFARFAWAGALGGPIVMIGSYVLSLGSLISTAGLVAAIGGAGFLISRRDKHVPPGEDFGDGAVV